MYNCKLFYSGSVAVTFADPNDATEIFLTQDPTSREVTYDAFDDDRVSVPLGTQFDPATTAAPDRVMRAAALLGSFRNLETQSIVWVRDGVVIAENGITPTDARYTLVATTAYVGGTDPGLWRTVLTINPFEASVAGVYQVIFTDAFVGGEEVLTTTPIRLDTGERIAAGDVLIIYVITKCCCFRSLEIISWAALYLQVLPSLIPRPTCVFHLTLTFQMDNTCKYRAPNMMLAKHTRAWGRG